MNADRIWDFGFGNANVARFNPKSQLRIRNSYFIRAHLWFQVNKEVTADERRCTQIFFLPYRR